MRINRPLTIIAASLLLFAACTAATTPTPTPAASAAASQSAAASPAGSAAAGTCTQGAGSGGQTVTIKDFAFSPADLSVAAGTTVTWTNNDTTAHDPVADAGSFTCPPIPIGQSMSVTFAKAGTYDYHCAIHPTMVAKITVT